ncbi:chromosome partitioning protein [Prosthecobacter fusiformis]|uniref:Chromosome partitioning protein n=1 Tax=Prosthecobacter fusiformis TaxID=48464 RepID=A0A4R7RI86_9BACT|nr:ParA family protein [Prosthecobacter fusiformis]TDU62505.1 chromosome partitioning protein [Prosthecobacter fusiformis]
MPAKIIAFINFKGGVGKTSNVVNLGAVLARTYHKRVLIVDLDAQCNATFWLLGHAERQRLEDEPQKTTSQIFRDHVNGTRFFDFDEAVIRGVPRSPAGNPHIPTLDLLGAHVDLLETEDILGARTLQPYFTFLEKTLKPHTQAYDYVFLDCPPNIYNVSKNALFFADHYVIPYVPDFLSLSGFRVFARVVKRFQDQASGYKPKLARPLIAAAIINRYKNVGNVFDQAINQLKLEVGDLRSKGLIHQKAAILNPPIRDCSRMASCSDSHLPVIIHDENAISSQDYEDMATDFLAHFAQF